MAIFYTDTGSIGKLQVSGSGTSIFSISGSGGPLLDVSDINATTTDIFTITSASIEVFNIDTNKNINISGSSFITGSLKIAGGLEVTSTTSGFLAPRMTTAQRNAIVSPSIGLIIYQTDGTEGLYQYTSTGWTAIGSGGTSGGSSAASSLFNYYNFI